MKSHPLNCVRNRVLSRSLCLGASLASVLVFAPSPALSQINDTEGVWRGTLSCGALKITSTRAGPAYSHPLALRAVVGGLTGQRDTASTQERFTGSLERSGKATLEGRGAWKDDPARSWKFRLQGHYKGAALRLDGVMESLDGKTRLRDCGADLVQVRPVTSSPAPARASAPAAPTPAAKNTAPAAVPVVPSEVLAQQKKLKQQKEAEELAAQTARDKALADKAVAEKAAAEKANAEKAITEKALADKAIADKAVADKTQADKARQDQAAQAAQAAQQAAQLEAARLAADKALADKRALEIKNREAKKEPIKARSSMDL
jgi:hypothetical protein